MKNIRRTLVLVLFTTHSLLSSGQLYSPLIMENKTWNVLNIIPNWGTLFDTSFNTSSYNIVGDSIIGSNLYKKLYASYEQTPVNWMLSGLIREDSTRKVWLKWPTHANEVLMYDFSLAAGDSIALGPGNPPPYYSVDSVTVVTVNGTPRKKIWLSQGLNWQESWTEGIGSNRGITNTGMLIGGWSWLLCMSESGVLVYKNPYYNTCYLVSSSINDPEKMLFKIYPNPTKDKLIIENTENAVIESISIISIAGQVIKSFYPGELQLDISDIDTGVVFLRISSGKGDIIKKLIIE